MTTLPNLKETEADIDRLTQKAEHLHKLLEESALMIAKISSPKFEFVTDWTQFSKQVSDIFDKSNY